MMCKVFLLWVVASKMGFPRAWQNVSCGKLYAGMFLRGCFVWTSIDMHDNFLYCRQIDERLISSVLWTVWLTKLYKDDFTGGLSGYLNCRTNKPLCIVLYLRSAVYCILYIFLLSTFLTAESDTVMNPTVSVKVYGLLISSALHTHCMISCSTSYGFMHMFS